MASSRDKMPEAAMDPQEAYLLRNYDRQQRLGEGTFGVVYRAKDLRTGEILALKRTRLESEDEGVPSSAVREIALLHELKHRNIVNLKDQLHNEKALYLVFEFLDLDLRHLMDNIERENRRRMDPDLVRSYMYQLLCGVAHCHSHRVLHRDLKPQNILLNREGHLKVADFGLGRAFSIPIRAYTHEVVTLWYRAPEILMGAPQYSTAIDMWSCGCIMAEMASLKALFPGDCDYGQLCEIFRVFGKPTEAQWPGVSDLPASSSPFPRFAATGIPQAVLSNLDANGTDLLHKLLAMNPCNRISARKALDHPYFDRIRQGA